MTYVAILGYGVVGTGLTKLIDKNKGKNDTCKNIELSGILVKNLCKHEKKDHFSIVTNDINDLLNRPVDVVVEVMGGLHPAYEYVKKALSSKKHVVTANKDLIAEYGKELLDLAKKNNVTLNFEASVGGGIPVIKPLIESLTGNDILSIQAILNGTTNFILTKMYNDNMEYSDALKLAQESGFAESNPDSDVLGYDSARKLTILSTISYNKKINWKEIKIEGITNLDTLDFRYAKENDCCIKLVASSSIYDKNIYASVRPTLVPLNSTLAKTDNEFNSIIINGDAVGEVYFYGKGAGMLPTASSVYGDLIDILQNKNKNTVQFSNDKAVINSYIPNEISSLIRVKTSNQKNTISNIDDLFNIVSLNVFDDVNDELGVMVKCKDEKTLEDNLNVLRSKPYINDVKSIIKTC